MLHRIQKEWLYSIKVTCLFTLLFSVTLLSSCDRINEVEVRVIDVESGAGIEGINVFYGEEQYVTDENGLVTIEGRNMEGREVTINRDVRGYTTPEFFENCTFKQVYRIENENLKIHLERFRVLKLRFELSENVSSRQGCLTLDDLENCDGKITLYYDLTQEGFVYPNNPSVSGNQFTAYMSKSSSPWLLTLYYDTYCEFDKSERDSDQVEQITMNSNQDTTYYTVYLP